MASGHGAQAALSTLEREAKENVYAVLDPHIQYEITINKYGEPPKYLSLSKPLTHQRTHGFDPQNIICNDDNNNNNNENYFTTFKSEQTDIRKSQKNKGRNDINASQKNYVCKTNTDVEYSEDPNFGVNRGNLSKDTADVYAKSNTYNENRNSKKYSQSYCPSSSRRRNNSLKEKQDAFHSDVKRASERSKQTDDTRYNKTENKRSFAESGEIHNMENKEETQKDYVPRTGKVKEIASRFNRNSMQRLQSNNLKRERPKPLQTYGHQAYLDHVFPDAVEI